MSQVWIVMPAYNASATLAKTYYDLPVTLRRNVILVDDGSTDDTVKVAAQLGIEVICHPQNKGYGANQKTCYEAALAKGAEVVVMVHPDFQYDGRMSLIMAEIIQLGICDFILGNRIRTRREALEGGMPRWKYFTNRISTFIENFILGQSIGDFHSGFRAYSRDVLTTIPWQYNSDDFAFDQEMIVQAVAFGFRLGDVPVPVRYTSDASSIGFKRSVRYGLGGLHAIGAFYLTKWHMKKDRRFAREQQSFNTHTAMGDPA